MLAVAICVGIVVVGGLEVYVLARRWSARMELFRTPPEEQPAMRQRIFRTTVAVGWTAVVVGGVTGLIINLRS